jgi:uncharacterized protein YdeI (YjbR/CyaY-like superfamily)
MAPAMITDIEDYFSKGCGRCERFATPSCSTRRWAKGLADLRRICLDVGLVETVKWGHPCYMHLDRNIAIIGAFRDDFRITFFNAALMQDPEDILEVGGPNTRHRELIRFRSEAQVADMQATIRAYLKEAMGYAADGVRPQKEVLEVALPDELVEALDADSELAEAFRSLTPGRQRSYAINLSSAKTSATRKARISKFREKIISGKGANER